MSFSLININFYYNSPHLDPLVVINYVILDGSLDVIAVSCALRWRGTWRFREK